MMIDMLRSAGEDEAIRRETCTLGGVAGARRTHARGATAATALGATALGATSLAASPAAPSAVDLRAPVMRALVMRAVVPRLAENLRARVPSDRPAAGLSDPVVGALVAALLRDDFADACRTIDAVRAGGRSLDRIYIDLLAPAAAAIARNVDAEACSAAAGTLAFCNLQLVLRRYAADFYGEGGIVARGSRALLVPMRAAGGGDLATFGLTLAADFLRRAGWEVCTEPSLGGATLPALVSDQWFDLVGVLVDEPPAADEVEEVAAGIRASRRQGSNPRCVIVACGRALARDPSLPDRLGADDGIADPLLDFVLSHQVFDSASHKQARRRQHLS